MEDLREAAPSRAEFLRILQNLPPTLTETYDRALRNKLKDKASLDLATRTFIWVALATRLAAVAEAVTIEAEDTHFEFDRVLLDDGRSLLALCGNLILYDAATDTISLAHSTVRDYLLSESTDKQFLRITARDAELHLCTMCLTHLCFTDFETAVSTQPNAMSPLHSRQSDALTGCPSTRRTLAVSAILSTKRGTRARAGTLVDLSVGRPKRVDEPFREFKLLPYAIIAWPHFCRSLDLEVEKHPKESLKSLPKLRDLWRKLIHVALATGFSPWCQPDVLANRSKENRMLCWAAQNGIVIILAVLKHEAHPDEDLQHAVDTCSADANPLILAWRGRHTSVVQYLTDPEIVQLPTVWRTHICTKIYSIALSTNGSRSIAMPVDGALLGPAMKDEFATFVSQLAQSEQVLAIKELRELLLLPEYSQRDSPTIGEYISIVLESLAHFNSSADDMARLVVARMVEVLTIWMNGVGEYGSSGNRLPDVRLAPERERPQQIHAQ